jgi:hypothetical protein
MTYTPASAALHLPEPLPTQKHPEKLHPKSRLENPRTAKDMQVKAVMKCYSGPCGTMAQAVERLPACLAKCQALSSNSSTTKKSIKK